MLRGPRRSVAAPLDLLEASAMVKVVRMPPTTGTVMTPAQLRSLDEVLQEAASGDPDLLLLTGTSPGQFGLGLSMEALRASGGRGDGYLRALQEASVPVVERLLTFPCPTAAVLTGPALGAHLTLALLCDVRGAVPGERTLLGFPEPGLGMLPSLGGVPSLSRVVGPVRAAELLVSGRRVGPGDARTLGLVDVVLDEEDPVQEMTAWCREQRRSIPKRRKKPRRYPQGRTWADLLLEGTPIGRGWLFRRLGVRLEGIMADDWLREHLLAGLRRGLEERPGTAIALAREEAAAAAIREPADNALSTFTMREWARKGGARWGIPQDAARRLQGAWYREGLSLLVDGMRIEDVDRAARKDGMGPGPCRLMDRDGLGQVVPLVMEAMDGCPDPSTDPAVEALMSALLEREMGDGLRFYRYGKGRPQPEQEVYHVVDDVRGGDDPHPPEVWEAADRLVLAPAAAASRKIDEEHPPWVWDLTAMTVLEWSGTGGGPLRRTERAGGGLLARSAELAGRWGRRLEVEDPPEGERWFPTWPLTAASPGEDQASSPR